MSPLAIELAEYRRPWKLASLAIGIGLLVLGAVYTPAPDWDVPISFIMAICTYLGAPWSMRVILQRRWRDWPLMLLLTWFAVDGSYALYWSFVDPEALAAMRDANWPVSLPLYGICGLFWLYRGSLRELSAELRLLGRRR